MTEKKEIKSIQNPRQRKQLVPFVQESEGRTACLEPGQQVGELYKMKPER